MGNDSTAGLLIAALVVAVSLAISALIVNGVCVLRELRRTRGGSAGAVRRALGEWGINVAHLTDEDLELRCRGLWIARDPRFDELHRFEEVGGTIDGD